MNFASYMSKLESWFVRVIKSVDLHDAIVPTNNDIRETVPSEVKG